MRLYDILKEGDKTPTIPCGGETVYYTTHFEIFFSNFENPSYSFEYKAVSDGNVELKIELEQGFTKPNIKASDINWCVPDESLTFNPLLKDEFLHIKAYPPTPTMYARFKITGLTGNDASTALDVLRMYIVR